LPAFCIFCFQVLLNYAFGKLEAYPTTNSAGAFGLPLNDLIARPQEIAEFLQIQLRLFCNAGLGSTRLFSVPA
jgi:hypothetical protein